MEILANFKKSARLVATAVGLLLAGSIIALAAPKTSVLRFSDPGMTEIGKCCYDWDFSVRVIEPERLVPIIVTWSTDYQANGPFYSGLRVNSGPCVFDGPGNISPFIPEDGLLYTTRTVQWLLMPGDYQLTKGVNVLTLCGGAVYSDTDTLTLGFGTLTAQPAF